MLNGNGDNNGEYKSGGVLWIVFFIGFCAGAVLFSILLMFIYSLLTGQITLW